MRFITISAAILLGSALSAANAQEVQSATSTPTNPKATPSTKTATGVANPRPAAPGQIFVSGGSDSCATATAIAGSGLFIGDNVGATHDTAQPSCRLQSNENVWYDWTALASGSTTFSTCPASALPGATASFDTVIAAYNGTGCVGTAVGCNDDGPGCTGSGFQSTLSFIATAGNVYKMQIMSWSLGATGTYAMAVSAPLPPPANDLCAAATPIAGLGLFPGNNTAGAIDVVAPSCRLAAVANVWYDWTCTLPGTTTITTCPADGAGGGSASFGDTVIEVYDTAACVGPAIVCNDDGPGCPGTFESTVSFPAIVGNVYKVQVAGWSAGETGPFVLEVTNTPPPPPTPIDDCSLPGIAITGANPYDNSAATTGVEGQLSSKCLAFGSTVIDNDLWYTWTADCTGDVQVSTCGDTIDTRIGAYAGSGCPTGSAIACSDDSCALTFQSALSFSAVAGAQYTIQVGTFPGASGGLGTFTISCVPTASCAVFHDGTAENAVAVSANGADNLFMHRQGSPGQQTVVKSISAAWGNPLAAPASWPTAGAPARFGIWDDPNDDGNLSDLVLLQEILTTIVNSGNGLFDTVSLSPTLQVDGVYYIGASYQNVAAGQFAPPLDQSTDSISRAWITAQVGGSLNYNSLGTSSIPPTNMDQLGFNGVWLLQCECKDLEITEMCAVTAPGFCPCGNDGAIGNGCANSVAPGGAHLAGSGNAITNADTVSVIATDVRKGNPVLALFLSGSETLPVPALSDGMFCGASNVLKLWTWKTGIPSGPVVTLTGPGPNTVPDTSAGIAARSAALGSPILNGETRVYTVLYRDPANFGCISPATTNYTNGLRILWSQL